eukprot:4111819-Amphidinium_carterae.1
MEVIRERKQKSREASTPEGGVLVSSGGRDATSGGGVLVSSEGRQRSAASGGGVLVSPEVRQDGVPMEVGTTRKRAAEAEADDGERASREETAESASREMRSLSLLLAEGATVLYGGSNFLQHEEFLDGRGCLYLTSLHTAVTVEEPETIVEWNRPRAECFYD